MVLIPPPKYIIQDEHNPLEEDIILQSNDIDLDMVPLSYTKIAKRDKCLNMENGSLRKKFKVILYNLVRILWIPPSLQGRGLI